MVSAVKPLGFGMAGKGKDLTGAISDRLASKHFMLGHGFFMPDKGDPVTGWAGRVPCRRDGALGT